MNTMSHRSTHWTLDVTGYPFAGEDEAIRLSPRGKQAKAAQVRKKNMERQGNAPLVRDDEEVVHPLFYHICDLHQTGHCWKTP